MIAQSGGGIDTSDATAVAADVRRGKVFYNNDGRQVGTNQMIDGMPSVSGCKTKSIPVQTSDLITTGLSCTTATNSSDAGKISINHIRITDKVWSFGRELGKQKYSGSNTYVVSFGYNQNLTIVATTLVAIKIGSVIYPINVNLSRSLSRQFSKLTFTANSKTINLAYNETSIYIGASDVAYTLYYK